MAFPRELFANVGVPLVSKLLDGVKSDVFWSAWTGDNGKGTDAFAAPVKLRAFVSRKSRLVRTSTGRLATIMATIQFVDPIPSVTPSNGTRVSPVDPRDKIVLADGQTAPIVDQGGYLDPITNLPFAPKVMLGTVTRGQ